MLYRYLRPAIFRLDPERAHSLVIGAARLGEAVVAATGACPPARTYPSLRQRLWGIEFPTPIGLAGGFDKSAQAPHLWAAFGFGFAELGTITAEAQPGNPKPRVFRLGADRALINRLGFNNAGAKAVATRLSRHAWRPAIPIGFNLGKSRVTPLERAAEDYGRSFESLFPFADYVVVNVSSPNTPGLRDLQAARELEQLLAFLGERNRAQAKALGTRPRPLLVKIAPDLDDASIGEVVAAARAGGASGIIATNTTIRRDGLSTRIEEAGGLSGSPLRARATEVVRLAYRASDGDLPVIGAGGVFSADDAYEKFAAGASLVQIYTGLIYEGPGLAHRIARDLARRLASEGVAHLRDIVGRG